VAILLLSMVACGQSPVTHDIRPGYGVTGIGWLSDFFPPLRGAPGDTRIYVLDSGIAGGTALILGGTHANEIAGIMAAVLLVERAEVRRGKLIVIPHANNAAFGYTDPTCPTCGPWVSFSSGNAARFFRYGSRLTNPAFQSPDSSEYIHPSGLSFAGWEARNLNRVYPGRADGTLTEKIAHAIVQLVLAEEIDYVFDLHEAGITSRLAYTLVCHPRALELGAMAVMDLELRGISMKLEPSREEFRGLSHRELGDLSKGQVFLLETPNPGQESGRHNPDVIDDPQYPVALRAGVHLSFVQEILAIGSRLGLPQVEVVGVPEFEKLQSDGLAAWLNW